MIARLSRYIVTVAVLAAGLWTGHSDDIRAREGRPPGAAFEALAASSECMLAPRLPVQQAGAVCLYLSPSVLHLTNGDTATLQVVDQSGTPQAGTLAFSGFDASLISVSPSGLVTALRTEGSSEIGTWVTVTLDGQPVANTCIVRVLSSSVPSNYVTAESEHTILNYPEYINGEYMTGYVNLYEMASINQYSYEIQTELMNTQPFGGCKQILQVDFGESETQRVCGISGNPLRLGWNIAGNEWQNCFLVPFIAPRSPQWFVIAHEVGHNTTWASPTFGAGLYDPGLGGLGALITYSEAMASVIAVTSYQRMLADLATYPMGAYPGTSILQQNSQYLGGWKGELQDYLDNGAEFGALGAGEVCAIWFRYDSLYPGDFAARYFSGLDPQHYDTLSPILQSVDDRGYNGVHTFFAALMSAAYEQDLSAEFTVTYSYIIVESLFDSAYTALLQIMGVNCYVDADGDGYGDDSSRVECFTGDCGCQPDLVDNHADCDDSDPNVHEFATEVCNGVDDNCNGQIDEGVAPAWYLDSDGDGFGDPASSLHDCSQPIGYVADSLDCDDTSPDIHPGAEETCNEADDNCNGSVDEGIGLTWYRDFDGDGYGRPSIQQVACAQPEGYVSDSTDCDDRVPSVHPDATEICNAIDDDCDAQIDEGYGPDDDADGYALACDSCVYLATPENASILTGDVNRDGSRTSSDIIYDVNYVFKAGAEPQPCPAAADVNCDDAVNSSDIIYMVNYVFKSGVAPCDVCVDVPGSTLCEP